MNTTQLREISTSIIKIRKISKETVLKLKRLPMNSENSSCYNYPKTTIGKHTLKDYANSKHKTFRGHHLICDEFHHITNLLLMEKA